MEERRNKFRDMIKYRAGALCLVGILSATFMHNVTFMSQFFYGSIFLGAVAAFAIDAGVVSMSIFKDELIKDGELAWMVRVVTVAVLAASGVANMAEGFKSAYGIQLTVESLTNMDWLLMVQWLFGTIIFPVLAYVMCDTVGTRNLVEFKKQQSEVVRPKKTATTPKNGQYQATMMDSPPQLTARTFGKKKDMRLDNDLSAANERIYSNKQQRMKVLEAFLDEYPDASLSEMASAVGVSSRETVRKYLIEMGRHTEWTAN